MFLYNVHIYLERLTMVVRNNYLGILRSFKDKDVIKVITGIRRSGKSTLLSMFSDEIRTQDRDATVIAVNFEDAEFRDIASWKDLLLFVNGKIVTGRKNYVFLDEVQQIEDFEKAVDSLFLNKSIDLYITGSNAKLLSGELATLLSGRYVEIKVMTYSFAEFLAARKMDMPTMRAYGDYVRLGGFPYVQAFGSNDIAIDAYLEGLYSTIVLKDVIARRKIMSSVQLDRVVHYLFDNIGNVTSIQRIVNALFSSGNKVSHPTIENYIEGLKDAYIVHQASRYDVRGRQILKSGAKYYVSDMGLRRIVLGGLVRDYGRILENVVYLELLRRCGDERKVCIGVADDLEMDFVATTGTGPIYVQVAASVRDEDTLKRELRPFSRLKDAYPRYLVTLDDDPEIDHNGVRQMNICNFLGKALLVPEK